MSGASLSQAALVVSGSRTMRVQSPSPSRSRGRVASHSRGRSGFQGSAVEVGTEIHQLPANEKEEMKELNARFAGYIAKVQALEQRNAALRAELADLQANAGGFSLKYEHQFKALKDLIETLTNEKGAADIERGYIEEDIEMWKLKLEEELALKEEAEMVLRAFQRDVGGASLQKAELEMRVEQLLAEIKLTKQLHAEAVADLLKQIEDAKVRAELEAERPDVAAYLRSIRAEIEKVAASNVQEAERWYKGKFETLKEQASKHEIRMKSMQEQVTVLHAQVTDFQNQIEGLLSRNELLELQLQDLEVNHLDKAAGMQQLIAQLESQISETKLEMSKYLQDYNKLLHIKLKLDTEIATYRTLLEGEEKRLRISEVTSASKTG